MSDYIPLELISDILTRLPFDDVLRCTRVCKSWYDLITSSSFISLHLKLSTPKQEPRLLVQSSVGVSDGYRDHIKVHRDNQTFDEIFELECPFKGLNKVIVGSINGLVCLRTYANSGYDNRISLWNPSLGKSFVLPNPATNLYGNSRFGFGFISETNDYKIVRLLLSRENTDFIQVEIYELSTNSWRKVSTVGQVSYFTFHHDPAAFLHGRLHWGVSILNNYDGSIIGRDIVSFDMKKETVRTLGAPNLLDYGNFLFDVSTFKDSLCAIFCTDTHFNVWVMKEYDVPDSWTMQFRIHKGYYHHKPLYLRENGEIILERRLSIFAKCGLVSYDLTSDKVTYIGNYEKNYVYSLNTYVESFALIKIPN